MWPSFDTLVLLFVAILNAVTLYYARRTEKNTNSITDALIKSTANEHFAAGQAAQRLVGIAEAVERKRKDDQK